MYTIIWIYGIYNTYAAGLKNNSSSSGGSCSQTPSKVTYHLDHLKFGEVVDELH